MQYILSQTWHRILKMSFNLIWIFWVFSIFCAAIFFVIDCIQYVFSIKQTYFGMSVFTVQLGYSNDIEFRN